MAQELQGHSNFPSLDSSLESTQCSLRILEKSIPDIVTYIFFVHVWLLKFSPIHTLPKKGHFLNGFYHLSAFWIINIEVTMSPHSSTLAWKIPLMEEPGRLQSMGSLRVGHDWVTSLSLFTFMHWRRKWKPTPVFLPGESQGRGSLVGCRLWGRTESDTTEAN